MFRRYSRIIAAIVICFFTWTSGGVFSVAHAAVDGVKKAKAAAPAQKPEGAEEKLSRLTEELRELLADPKQGQGKKRDRLLAARTELDTHDAAIRAEFSATEKKLKDAKLPPEILERHARFVKHYDDNLKELQGNIARVEAGKDEKEIEVEIEKTRKHLEKTKAPSRHQKLDPNNLPHRQPKVIKREPRMKKEEFDKDLKKDKHAWRSQKRVMLASTGSTSGLLLPDDLAETVEVQFTPEIKAKALELGNNPVKIYEWVRNNIEFVPTWGSIQGAQMTMLTRQGNAFDTASLLIALLRAAGIHARYVTGTVELPIDKVINWLGGFTSEQAALEFMASGGVPVTGIISGGKISKARFEHIWVEAWIPYGNYRGSMRDQNNPTWIPLDPSFKQYSFVKGFDVTTSVPFDQDSYLSQPSSQNSVHYYQSNIQAFLDTAMPDKSIVDVKGKKEIMEEKFRFLPASLPYKAIVTANKTSAVPDTLRSNISFRMKSSNKEVSDPSYSITAPELAGKRVTISYRPATATDEALVASYGGIMFNVPAYMLQVMPELRIEGTVVLTGEATTIGNEQLFSLQIAKPNGTGEFTQKTIIAGGYYGIGFDMAGVNEGSLGNRNGKLRNNISTLPPEAFSNDDLIGEHLNLLAMTYFLANDKLYSSGAKLYNVAQTRSLSGTFTSIIPSVTLVFSIPRSVTPSGLEMDVRLDRVTAVAKDGNHQAEKLYMEMIGLVSSYNEHYIFEAIDGLLSVSTVKVLQTANQNGISIYKINSANLNQELPNLQVHPEVIEDIKNAVNAGNEITIPQRNVQIGDWNGVGYIVKDPTTGSGAYMISGGLAGGTSCVENSAYYLQLYKGPYAGIRSTLDLQTQNTIVTAATLEIGEEIAETAEDIMNLGVSYKDIGMCTGLVIKSYAEAGVNLRKIAKDKGFGPPENASNMYLMVKNTSSFRVGAEGPNVGDIIFFHDTNPERDPAMKRPGDDGASHVAIVTEVQGGEVMSMIHAAGSKKGIVLVSFPNGMMANQYRYDHFLTYGRPR